MVNKGKRSCTRSKQLKFRIEKKLGNIENLRSELKFSFFLKTLPSQSPSASTLKTSSLPLSRKPQALAADARP
jgi:hypothetical protein